MVSSSAACLMGTVFQDSSVKSFLIPPSLVELTSFSSPPHVPSTPKQIFF